MLCLTCFGGLCLARVQHRRLLCRLLLIHRAESLLNLAFVHAQYALLNVVHFLWCEVVTALWILRHREEQAVGDLARVTEQAGLDEFAPMHLTLQQKLAASLQSNFTARVIFRNGLRNVRNWIGDLEVQIDSLQDGVVDLDELVEVV